MSIKNAIIAGSVATIVCNPIDMIRINIQLKSISSWDFIRFIYQTKGILGFYKGLNIGILTIPCFWSIYFPTYEKLKINNYIIDLNSREMLLNNLKLKLTEKETNTIIYLSKKNKAVSVDELQEDVWSYQPDIETHTVETHIYRLRKKILNIFHDNDFIISEKNGYKIK